MQAQEQVSIVVFGEGYAVGERELAVVSASQKNLPAIRDQQALQTPRPIECKLFFPASLHGAFGSRVFSPMSRIQDQNRSCVRKNLTIAGHQGLEGFA